jgi:hypothetical protein
MAALFAARACWQLPSTRNPLWAIGMPNDEEILTSRCHAAPTMCARLLWQLSRWLLGWHRLRPGLFNFMSDVSPMGMAADGRCGFDIAECCDDVNGMACQQR